ncbi:hypothetical protein [Rhizosphaericola mali]|uniref:DUF4890 domain-containing protein n=1 Tax=Rhizosphaericola mali TaxID=2545455 RepID=A0A5P2G6F2_9BACT|nr:hypothetical protein [Rhizosphaericola mali]QES89849.1 hypothetical protein E0W69_014685 [Rhizosphaericola mali]
MAQRHDGPPPKMDSATMRAMDIKRLKSADLGLSDVQIDSVININQEMRSQMHQQTKKDKAEKKKERQEMESYQLTRLKTALGDDKLAQEVMDYYKKNKGPRGGGHGDGGDEMPPPPPGGSDMEFDN